MNRNSKKGFTIVELIIVIAVIAVLAAVLIPTFSNLIQKANEAKDTALVSNLNKAVAMDNGSKETVYDVLKVAEDIAGINVAKINAAANSNEILWDSTNKCFVYSVNGEIKYIPDSKTKDVAGDYDYWKLSSNQEDVKANKYSIYWTGAALSEITATTGFDAGDAEIAEVKYDRQNESVGRKVTIRTNGGKLTVNAPQDTVAHYGKASGVQITAVYGNSYHEYGEVVGDIVITKGRIELAATAQVGTVLVASEKANDVKVDVVSGAQVGTVAPTTDAAKADVTNSTSIPTESKQTEIVPENKDFAGGLGTERSPYLIATAEQFAAISNYQTEMVTKALSFSIVKDIDLNSIQFGKKYVSYVFNGTLNGNNHKIYTGNELSYLFYSTIGHTTYKDFTLSLNDKLTRVTVRQAATSETERTELLYENVDLTSATKNKYDMGSDNSAYYANSTFCSAIILAVENEKIVVKSNGFWTQNQYVTISNCDVDVDFTMTGNRAAVFCGGQVYSMHIAIKDCSYSGNFYGANPGLVFANQAYCEGEALVGSIELTNVKLFGKLICLKANAAHGLTFANNSKEFEGVSGADNIVECAVDSSMNITLNKYSEYVITAASDKQVDSYVIQLSLGKLFWYDVNGNVTTVEASNYTFSIRVSSESINSTGVYKVSSLSIKQAQAKEIDVNSLSWKDSENDLQYAFTTIGGETVLVVDVNGDFADETKLNIANIIGYVGDMPKYYRETK